MARASPHPAQRLTPRRDKIAVDGRAVVVAPASRPAHEYIVLNKPAGYLSTVFDPEGRPTVLDLVRKKGFNIGAGSATEDGNRRRLYPVGRLDLDSEGLLLLTDDGDLANRLTHPRYNVAKEYLALVIGRPERADIAELRQGVRINIEIAEGEYEQVRTQPAEVELLPLGAEKLFDIELPRDDVDAWHDRFGRNSTPEIGLLRIAITEGKKRQVRLMCDAIGHRVRRLRRLRMGNLSIENLDVGDSRRLKQAEIVGLRRLVGLKTDVPTPPAKTDAASVARARANAERSFRGSTTKPIHKGEDGVRTRKPRP